MRFHPQAIARLSRRRYPPPIFGMRQTSLSGRIGDVCAELDRLAALEAASGQQTLLH